jgi:hypothetical protein
MNVLEKLPDLLTLFSQQDRVPALVLLVLLLVISIASYIFKYHSIKGRKSSQLNTITKEEAKEKRFYDDWGIAGKMKRNLERQRKEYSYAIRRTEWRSAHSHLVFFEDKAQVRINWYFVFYHYLATGGMLLLAISGLLFLIVGIWFDKVFYEASATAFVNAIAIVLMYLPVGRSYYAARKLKRYINT